MSEQPHQHLANTPIRVSVGPEDFDVGAELGVLAQQAEDAGAVASFVGRVRQAGDAGDGVRAMTLEHYPGMTERALQEIAIEATQRWRCAAICIIHRVGRLLQGEQIVLVAVASKHRADAFAACEYIMDFLKTRAPLWKREETRDGARWVEARSSDDAAAARWAAESAEL